MIDHYEETKYTNQLPTEYVVKEVYVAWVEITDDCDLVMVGAFRKAEDACDAMEKWCTENNLSEDNDGICCHCDLWELK